MGASINAPALRNGSLLVHRRAMRSITSSKNHAATDRCLCCVPRRLRHRYFWQFSRIFKDASVTASTSANTQTTIDLRLSF
jgi:hypothetical protein